MKNLILAIALAMLLMPAATAQDVSLEVQAEGLTTMQRLELTAGEEFRDEFDPFYRNVWIKETQALWNPYWQDFDEWGRLEKQAEDHFLDAASHTTEEMLTESEWFQNLEEDLEERLSLFVEKHYSQQEGDFGERKFALDIGSNILRGSHNDKWLLVNTGISLDHIQDPEIFLTMAVGRKGRLPWVINDFRLEPVDQQIEWSMTELPLSLDWRVQYDLGDETLDFDFLGIPLVKSRPRGIAFHLGGRHNFAEDQSLVILRASGDAEKVLGWLFGGKPRESF